MKKNHKIFLIVLIILISIFIGSYYYIKNMGNFEYKGRLDTFKFTTTKIGEITIYKPELKLVDNNGYNYTFIYAFRNKPDDLKDVYLEFDIGKKLEGEKVIGVFITKDPELSKKVNYSVSIATAPVITILGRSDVGIYKLDIKNVYTKYNEQDPNVDIKDCNFVNESIGAATYFRVIEYRLGNENKVYSDGYCIIVEGKDEKGLIQAGEKLGYYLIGVF